MKQREAGEQSHYVSDVAVAKRLSVSVATVRRWRLKGEGPCFAKFGSTVRYYVESVDEWARAREVAR